MYTLNLYVSVGVKLATFLKKKAEEKEGLSQCNIKRKKLKIEKITKKLEPRKKIKEEAKIKLIQIKAEEQNSEVDENGGVENDKVKITGEHYREDIKEEKSKEDNTKEEKKVSDENKIDVKLIEELSEDKEDKIKEIIKSKLKQGGKRDNKEIVEETKRQHKIRRCHRRHDKLCTKGTRGAKDFEKRRSFEKTRLFQDKEDRRKHEEALVSRLYKIS